MWFVSEEWLFLVNIASLQEMKIFGIGMNYQEHNKELQDTLLYKDPVVFTKADSSLLMGGKPFFIPHYTQQCEYETELVVRINHLGRSIPERFAHRYYDEVTVGIDFTARDLQCKLRKAGLPWELSKGFDGSAVIGTWTPLAGVGEVQDLHFHLDINGHTVQRGYTGDMLHGVDKIISYLSQFFMLKTGDIIFTGTPAGVGAVHVDDHLQGYLEDKLLLDFHVR